MGLIFEYARIALTNATTSELVDWVSSKRDAKYRILNNRTMMSCGVKISYVIIGIDKTLATMVDFIPTYVILFYNQLIPVMLHQS